MIITMIMIIMVATDIEQAMITDITTAKIQLTRMKKSAKKPRVLLALLLESLLEFASAAVLESVFASSVEFVLPLLPPEEMMDIKTWMDMVETLTLLLITMEVTKATVVKQQKLLSTMIITVEATAAIMAVATLATTAVVVATVVVVMVEDIDPSLLITLDTILNI